MKNFVILVACSIACLMSCTTVKVTKVTQNGNEQGIRYSLGKPYIQVTPNSSGDGAYAVEVIYLPDQDQTYAVQSKALFAKSTMEISVDENGILKKVDWTANSDATIGEATKSLGEIAKAELTRKKEVDDKEAAEAKEKIKASAELVGTLNETLEQKRIDLKIAKQDLATLQGVYKGAERTPEIKEKIRQARLLVTRLEDEISNLTKKLSDAKMKSDALSAAANDPAAGPDSKAWGPVLFAIVESKDKEGKLSVSLKAVEMEAGKKQLEFKTANKISPIVPPATVPTLTVDGTLTEPYTRNGIATVKLSFDNNIEAIDSNQSQIISRTSTTNPNFQKINISIANKKDVTLVFDRKDFPAGTYDLNLVFSYKDGTNIKENSASIVLELKN